MFDSNVIKGLPSGNSEGSFVEIKVSDIWKKHPKGEYPTEGSPSLEDTEMKEDEDLLLTNEIARKKQEIEQINLNIQEQESFAKKIISEALTLAESIKEEAEKTQREMLIQKQHFEREQDSLRKQLLDEIEDERKEIIKQAYEEKEHALSAVEPEVACTIKDILGHLVSEEIYSSKEWIQCFVRKSLFNENIDQNIKLVVSPLNFEALQKEGIENLQQFRYNVDIVQDNRLADDVCYIETTKGLIEYNITKSLEQILKEIDMLQQFKKQM